MTSEQGEAEVSKHFKCGDFALIKSVDGVELHEATRRGLHLFELHYPVTFNAYPSPLVDLIPEDVTWHADFVYGRTYIVQCYRRKEKLGAS